MDEASKDGFARQGRREVLVALALALGGAVGGHAAEVHGGLPWIPEQTQPPEPVSPGGWRYFTADEAATVEALVDRLIPPDPEFQAARMRVALSSSIGSLPGHTALRRGSTRQVHSMMEPKSKGRSRRSIRGITIASHWRRSTSIAARGGTGVAIRGGPALAGRGSSACMSRKPRPNLVRIAPDFLPEKCTKQSSRGYRQKQELGTVMAGDMAYRHRDRSDYDQ